MAGFSLRSCGKFPGCRKWPWMIWGQYRAPFLYLCSVPLFSPQIPCTPPAMVVMRWLTPLILAQGVLVT